MKSVSHGKKVLRLRLGFTFAGLVLVICFNNFTLGALTEDGVIDGVEKYYIWFFDIILITVLLFFYSGRFRKLVSGVLYAMIIMGGVEGACVAAFYLKRHEWPWQYEFRKRHDMFDAHPYLVGVPKPNARLKTTNLHFSHNNLGFRGKDFNRHKAPGTIRVIALGGSSTYGTGVIDEETWPVKLEQCLGKPYEVVNFGVPGYSTVENLIQSLFYLSEFEADFAVYYLGWNELPSMHVKDLKPDFSGFHGKRQYASLNLPLVWQGPLFSSIFFIIEFLQKSGLVHKTPDQTITLRGEISSEINERALGLYRRNLGLLAAICKKQGVEPVFVPQIMNYDRMRDESQNGWFPFVMDKDVKKLIKAYNSVMQEVAEKDSVTFIGSVLSAQWKTSDFVDNGHFSSQGGVKFAGVICANLFQ